MDSNSTQREREPSFGAQIALISFGLAAPLATYAIAVSGFDQGTKVGLLVGLSIVYAAICVWTLVQLRKAAKASGGVDTAPARNVSDLEQKLLALEDAREFFGTSLKPSDMFRLAANRINEIVPFESCLLFIKDAESGTLRAVQAYGASAKQFEAVEIPDDASIAGLSFFSGEIENTADLAGEREAFPFGVLSGFGSTAAVPLTHDGDAFASLQLFFGDSKAVTQTTLDKLHAVGDRIAPLFLGTMAFERSLSNALTDPLTKLPNERAFYMVLENQLAESHRFRDERPLTVLAVDIKNFEEMNRDHGHAVGDRALAYAAEKIATQLRKMDFLARSMNDEFLIVLPKATERTAIEITDRIQSCLAGAPMEISAEESLKLWLNFGWATFWHDGETSQQLVHCAYTRKQQAKSEDPESVVMLPKEYVN